MQQSHQLSFTPFEASITVDQALKGTIAAIRDQCSGRQNPFTAEEISTSLARLRILSSVVERNTNMNLVWKSETMWCTWSRELDRFEEDYALKPTKVARDRGRLEYIGHLSNQLIKLTYFYLLGQPCRLDFVDGPERFLASDTYDDPEAAILPPPAADA